jgi:hypothetical protein
MWEMLKYEKTWNDEDSSLTWVDIEGKEHSYSLGDTVEKVNVAKAKQLIYSNPSTTAVYGNVVITQNDRYGDYDIEFNYVE